MATIKVYLAGPIWFDEENWRETIRRDLEKIEGLQILDPTKKREEMSKPEFLALRKKLGRDSPEYQETMNTIYYADLRLIRASDILVAYLPHKLSVGTCQEIFYAHEILAKPTIILTDLNFFSEISLFLDKTSTKFYHKPHEILTYLEILIPMLLKEKNVHRFNSLDELLKRGIAPKSLHNLYRILMVMEKQEWIEGNIRADYYKGIHKDEYRVGNFKLEVYNAGIAHEIKNRLSFFMNNMGNGDNVTIELPFISKTILDRLFTLKTIYDKQGQTFKCFRVNYRFNSALELLEFAIKSKKVFGSWGVRKWKI